MKLLLYCTKAKPYLVKRNIFAGIEPSYFTLKENVEEKLNGKIVAECDFEVEEIRKAWGCLFGTRYYTSSLDCFDLYEKSYLSFDEINNYLKGTLNEYCGYAIHIKNLHIFDKPKELNDYYKFDGIYNDINNWKTIDKAPQNMMYAYDLISELGFSGTYNIHLKKNILISIKPEWLCKILNGEKTIEVRKKVLKEMLS